MTDELDIEKPVETTTQNSDTLSTREIMEANWDRLVLPQEEAPSLSTDEKQEAEQSLVPSAPDEKEEKTASPFEPVSYLEEHFSDLKEQLNARGISSLKEWVNSLVTLEKEYIRSPETVIFKLAEQAGFSLPKKEDAQQILTDYALKNNISPDVMKKALKAKASSSVVPQEKAFTLDKSAVQSLIQEGISAYFKEKEAETKKAKNSSFSPSGVGQNVGVNPQYMANGRPKTTREILEEGCRLLGI